MFLYRDKVWLGHEFSCHDGMFLCHDRVGNGGEALCHDRILYAAIECGQMERYCVATGNFMLRHSWPGLRDFLL